MLFALGLHSGSWVRGFRLYRVQVFYRSSPKLIGRVIGLRGLGGFVGALQG